MARKQISINRTYGASWGVALVRIVIHDGSDPWGGVVEITCAPTEEQAIVGWARARYGLTYYSTLPVAEYQRAPWGPDYRWTMLAELVYRTATKRAA